MTIDLNNVDQISQLKKAAKTPGGRLIIEFLRHKQKSLSFEKINTEKNCQEVGEEFKAVKKANKFINEAIDFLIK